MSKKKNIRLNPPIGESKLNNLPDFSETIGFADIAIALNSSSTLDENKSFDSALFINENTFSQFECRFDDELRSHINKLNELQKKSLAALLIDCKEWFFRHKIYSNTEMKTKDLGNTKRLAKNYTKLNRKVDDAIKAIKELLKQAQSMDESITYHHRRVAEISLHELDWIPRIPPKHWSTLKKTFEKYGKKFFESTNPCRKLMASLGWFFVGECGWKQTEAEIVVALIRNQLWKDYVKPITDSNIIRTYNGDRSPGCTTVRTAMKDFPPDDTTAKQSSKT